MLKQIKNRKMRANPVVLGIAALMSLGATAQAQEIAGPSPQAEQPQTRAEVNPMQQANMRLQQIDTRLQAAQERAMETGKVSEQREKLESLVKEKILEEDEDLKDVLSEHQDLQEELMEDPTLQDPTTPPSPELQERIQKYQALEQQIAPARQAVMQSDEVVEMQEAFRDLLISEMERIEPETQDLIAEGQRIITQMQQMQMQAPAQAPPAATE